MRYWLPILTVAGVWFVHLAVSYFLAWADCATTWAGLLIIRHVATALGLILIVALSIRAQRASALPARLGTRRELAMEQSFLAGLTVTLGLMFIFATALAGAANLFLGPCS
jgi:hypothetical protein